MEDLEVADVRLAANIALQVGPHVGVEPVGRLQIAIVDGRVEAGMQDRVQPHRRRSDAGHRAGFELLGRERRPLRQFREREGQELQDRSAAGERLTDAFGEQVVLRTGHDQGSGTTLVDEPLDVGEQVGRVLGLVEDRPRQARQAVEEAARVFARFLAILQIFQGDVAEVREGEPRQGGLARLPRAREEDHGELRGQGLQAGHEGAVLHGRHGSATSRSMQFWYRKPDLHGLGRNLCARRGPGRLAPAPLDTSHLERQIRQRRITRMGALEAASGLPRVFLHAVERAVRRTCRDVVDCATGGPPPLSVVS